MDFKEFLVEENHLLPEKSVFISKRFGDYAFWKIKGISENYFRENFNTDFDYWCNLCVMSLIFPIVDSKELMENYEVDNSFDLIKKMLYPAEYQRLIFEIKEINGFKERKQRWKEIGKRAISEGLEDCDYAFYALRNFGIIPSKWASMSKPEKMFICAGIDVEIEAKMKAVEKVGVYV